MKKYILALILFLAALSQFAYAQRDFKTEFKTLFNKNDLAGQEKVLKSWEKSKPDDPELFIAYFNFYLNKSRTETLSLTATPKSKDALKMTKEDDETSVAYLGSQETFERKDFDKAIEYISRGIEKFPNRLDMRFGKTAAFGKIEDYQKYTDEIVKAIDYSNINKNQWLWLEGKPLSDGKTFMLKTVQAYIVQVVDANEDTEYIKTIAETILKYYPDSVENLSNLAVYYLFKEDYANALIHLQKAEKLAPTDPVILGNIAWSYYSKGDRINALKYYELLLKYGDEDAKNQAKEKIAELKSK